MSGGEGQGAGGSVLVADYDFDLVSELEGELTRRNFAVRTASSAQEVLRIVRENSVDVLVTELSLGSTYGFELLKILPEKSPSTRVVVMASEGTADDYVRALDLGVVTWLTKPLAKGIVADAVRTAMDRYHGFHGGLHGLSLPDILRALHRAKRSESVLLGDGAAIHMRGGEIVHAEHGSKTGEAALVSLLDVDAVSLRTTPLQDCEQTIFVSFEGLLLQSAGKADHDALGGAAHHDEKTGDRPPARAPHGYRRSGWLAAAVFAGLVLVALSAAPWVVGSWQTSFMPGDAPGARRLRVRTRPSGLEIVHAESHLVLGRSPVTLHVDDADLPVPIGARIDGRILRADRIAESRGADGIVELVADFGSAFAREKARTPGENSGSEDPAAPR